MVEYFDAFLVGLTATPARSRPSASSTRTWSWSTTTSRAVADGVNVDFEVYRIRTRITEGGATVEALPDTMLGYRHRRTRAVRWETPDEDLSYDRQRAGPPRRREGPDPHRRPHLPRRLLHDLFPGRKEVPKTLIFAKDDSHAEDIVEIVREEFGRGNDFCRKITYKVTDAEARAT